MGTTAVAAAGRGGRRRPEMENTSFHWINLLIGPKEMSLTKKKSKNPKISRGHQHQGWVGYFHTQILVFPGAYGAPKLVKLMEGPRMDPNQVDEGAE